MKRIVLICSICLFWVAAKSQVDSFPTKTPQGTSKTLIDNLGGLRGGLINRLLYADTTTANTLAYFKFYNGAQLVTYTDSVQFWIRYGNRWNKVSGGGGGSGVDTAVVREIVSDSMTYLKNATSGTGQILYRDGDTVKAKIFAPGFGLDLDSTTTALNVKVDTVEISTKANMINVVNDTAAALRAAINSGGGGSGNDTLWTARRNANHFGLDSLSRMSVFRNVSSGGGGSTYATWGADRAAGMTLSGGDLVIAGSAPGTTHQAARATIGKSSGKWYFEITATSVGSGVIGVATSSAGLTTILGGDSGGWGYKDDGEGIHNAGNVFFGASWTTGDIISGKLDMDAGTFEVLKNNVSVNTFTGLTGTVYPAISSGPFAASTFTANFGASAFTYSVPSGYNAGVYTSGGSSSRIPTFLVDSLGHIYIGDSSAVDTVNTYMALALDSNGRLGKASVLDTKNYLNTDALTPFVAEVSKIKSATKTTTHVAFIGDSNTDADGVFQKPLQEYARLSGFNVVPGWSCANPSQYPSYGVLRGVSGGWVQRNRTDSGKSVSLNSITSNDNSQYIQLETVTSNIQYDGLKIFYLRRTGGGTINYIEGGITLHTQSTAGTNGTVGVWDIPSLSWSTRDLVLRPAGTDSVEILGVYMYSKSVPSIAISKFAHTGASSADYAAIGSQFDVQVDSMDVDLAIVNIGTNDEFYNFTSSSYATNLTTICDRLPLDSVKSVMIVAPSDNNTNPTSGKINFVRAAKSVAILKEAAFVSLYDYHGEWNSYSGLWIDDVHFNYTWAGYKNIDLIGGLLFAKDKGAAQITINSTSLINGASGKILFQNSLGKISEHINFHFDSTNVRLGIGTATPDYDIHVRKTVNGNVISAIINESAGTSSASHLYMGRSIAGDYFTDFGYTGENYSGTYPAASFYIQNSSQTTGGFTVNNVASAPITLMTNNTNRLVIGGNGSWTVGGGTGTSGQVLQSNGSGSSPSWVNAANLASSNLIQTDNIRRYELGYANSSSARWLIFGKEDYSEKAHLRLYANKSAGTGYASILTFDSLSNTQVAQTWNGVSGGGSSISVSNTSTLANANANLHLDSFVVKYNTLGKMKYILGDDSLIINGTMPVSSSSSDSVLVRDGNGVIKTRAQNDIGGGWTQTVATDANITAADKNLYHLPAATLSTARTINVSGLTDGQSIKILNNEAGFTWSFTGATVYLVDGSTTVTNLTANAFYEIIRINGKFIIVN